MVVVIFDIRFYLPDGRIESMRTINLEKFFKVYGDEGIQLIRIEPEQPSVSEMYKGLEVRKIEKLSGYGVRLAEFEYEVFDTSEEASEFYVKEFGLPNNGMEIADNVIDYKRVLQWLNY